MTVGSARLQLHGVTRKYVSQAETVWAVRDVTLTTCPGELIVVRGRSGSGKSTLLRLIAGLEPPDSGRITLGELSLNGLSPTQSAQVRLEQIGVVFQGDNLIEEFTVAENIGFPLELLRRPREVVRAEVDEWMNRVGILGLGQRFPSEISGGQRQRVGIARALTGNRKLVVADEPTGSLDSATAREIFTLLQRLCGLGVTAVIASHDAESATVADRLFIMNDGYLVEEPAKYGNAGS